MMKKILKLGFPVEKKLAIAAKIGQQQQNVDPKEFLSWGVQLRQSLLAIPIYYDKYLMIFLLDIFLFGCIGVTMFLLNVQYTL